MRHFCCSRVITYLLLISSYLYGEPYECTAQFGYISYSTTNIGDDIQAVAAKRFLPEDSIPINREFVSEFTHESYVYR